MTQDPEIQQRIRDALRMPELVEPALKRRHPILQLSREPALRGTQYAWVIASGQFRRAGSSPIVREVRCTRGKHAEIAVRDVEIDAATVEAWCREGAAIPVPLVHVASSMGVDGVTYTLHTRSGFNLVNLRWWGNGPEEWKPLMTWAYTMMERLHALMVPGEPL